MFSLTGIFHGSAEGMSLGHTWHWGILERSYQIPLGKPGLVIPRCETLASRSVTFPLHQRKVQRCTPFAPSFSPRGSCSWGSKGKKEWTAIEREISKPPPPLTAATKPSDSIQFSLQTDAQDSRDCSHSWRSQTHLETKRWKNLVLYVCTINMLKLRACSSIFILSSTH